MRLFACPACGATAFFRNTACGACGAPIHLMKGLPRPAERPAPDPRPRKATLPVPPPSARPAKSKRSARPLKAMKKRAKGLFDAFEDVFDDVFDLFD